MNARWIMILDISHFIILFWYLSIVKMLENMFLFLISLYSLGLDIKLTNSLAYSVINGFSSVQSLSHVRLFATPWIAAHQASLSITNTQNSLRLASIESVMPSSHPILGHPLLLLRPIPPSIRVFSNESTLRMRWPKYWSFSFSIIPSQEIPGLISFRMDRLSRPIFFCLFKILFFEKNKFGHVLK